MHPGRDCHGQAGRSRHFYPCIQGERKMKRTKPVYLFAAVLILSLGAGAFCLTLKFPKPVRAMAAQEASPAGNSSTKPVDPRDVNPDDVPNKVTNFLGNLTPGAAPEAAGHERDYIVSYQVDFLRKQPGGKATEEGMTYEALQSWDKERGEGS